MEGKPQRSIKTVLLTVVAANRLTRLTSEATRTPSTAAREVKPRQSQEFRFGPASDAGTRTQVAAAGASFSSAAVLFVPPAAARQQSRLIAFNRGVGKKVGDLHLLPGGRKKGFSPLSVRFSFISSAVISRSRDFFFILWAL